MAPLDHVSQNRLRIAKHTIGAFLILDLVGFIVLAFIVPSVVEFIMKTLEAESFGPTGSGKPSPDPQMIKEFSEMVGKF